MDTLQRRLRYVAACGLFGTAVAAALATGCTGDDNVVGGADAAPDHTADVTTDVGQKETSLQDTTQTDTSTTDGASNDATVDAQGDAAKTDADAATTADASDAADTSTGDGSDGAVGVPACVTTTAQLGAPTDGAASKILFAFDDASDAGIDPAFAAYATGSVIINPPILNPADGHPCAGSLSTTVTYSGFSKNAQVYYNYGATNAQDWSSYSVLHFWVKVMTADPTTISGVEPRLDTGTAYNQHFGNFANGTTFADGGWHEVTLNLPIADAGSDMVVGFQLELQTGPAPTDGGLTPPPPATFLIDSIWLD
jgi:hypothetical protein